jgi:hypothetical protein
MKYFVIGIGGTGMRCLEAFTHLCAAGMFENMEIDILSIDTDTNNGNKGRTEQLLERYRRIKGGDAAKPTVGTFFSAKLNLFKYAPEYSGNRARYDTLADLNSGIDDVRQQNRDLSDLLFDRDVQKFDLSHGYRAQTHLGSHLMYHCLVEAARAQREGRARKEDKALVDFINRIYQAGADARVFILGSIFGGTGASSIPIVPRALAEALKVADPNAKLSDEARFGCSLLTDYFKFTVPDAQQLLEQKVIANSNNFACNSQAALMFYEDDATVQNTYSWMYHVGWPSAHRKDFSLGKGEEKTITGGGEQKNPAHIVELLCAAAAHDFFQRSWSDSEKGEIVFRSANQQDGATLFEAADLLGTDQAKLLMNRLGSLFALAHIVVSWEKGGEGQNGTENLVKKFAKFGTADYVNLPQTDLRDIDDYLKGFAFTFDKGDVVPGWLLQVRETVHGSFLFRSDAYSTNAKQLLSFNFGKLFEDESHQFARRGKLGLGEGDPYQEFLNTILKDETVKPDVAKQRTERLNERFLAHSHNTLTKLFAIL